MFEAIWIAAAEVSQLPIDGPAWEQLLAQANATITPDLGDPGDDGDVQALGAALVWARTGGEPYRNKVVQACQDVIGTEGGSVRYTALNLTGYVLAADLVGYRDPAFVAWVDAVRDFAPDGRTLYECHEERPNNWGTDCGGARVAAALYLGDAGDLVIAAEVFLGWLDGSWPHDYGELCWQAEPQNPVGINRAGALLDGLSVDGVLPDDQRRSGECPPSATCENYVRTALQGILIQAWLLERWHLAPAWTAWDSGVRRAMEWMDAIGCAGETAFPTNDAWLPWLTDWIYGTGHATVLPPDDDPGKMLSFTPWLFPAHSCRWDLNRSGAVGAADFLLLLAQWGQPYDVSDFLSLLAAKGPCP